MSEKITKTAEKVDDIVAGKQTDRARKDHDERVKMIRERHEQEHERRLAELRAAEERGEKLLRTKEAEREKRAKEMKEKEFSRRHAVEDRRKQMELNENLKRQQILAKYDVAAASATAPTNNNNIVNSNSYNNSPTARSSFRQPRFGQFERNHPARSTYAFGSSTPRKLTYLERLDPSMKLYNTRLRSSDAGHHGNGLDDDSSVSMTASMCSQPRNVPGYGRRSFFGTNANPTALTMCTKRPAGFIYPSSRSNDVTSPSDISFASSCMTTSFALGDSSPSVTPIKNVRRQNYFSSTYSADCRNFVPSRAKPQTGTEKTIRTSKNVSERNDSSTPKPPPPRPSPPVRNKIVANNNVGQNKKSTVTTTKPTATISKEKTPPKNNNIVASQNDDATKRFADDNVEVSMNSAMITANILNDNVLNSFQSNVVDVASLDSVKNTNGISTGEPVDEFGLNNETSSNSTPMVVNGTYDDETKEIPSSNSSNLLSSSTYGGEVLSSVPTPTGKNLGKSLTMEEAKAALAERRRLAREQLEREKELEKQREEQKRLEEEELLRYEEEQFRLQEEEERRFLEETRKAEELRLQIAIEEERRRREEEERAAEDEKQRAIENEIKVREMNERLEKEREEKLRKEEEERLERKKKLDAIMQRTRQSATDNGNNSSSSGDEATTIKSSVETPSMTKSSSASVMKKFTDDVGRSVGSILNRVRSTTKADKTLISKTDNVDAANGGSISTSTMNVSPNFDRHPSSTGEENYFNSTPPIHPLPVTPSNVDTNSSDRNSNGCTTTNGDVVNNHNIYNNDDDNHLLVDLNNISFDINANNLDVDDVHNNGVVVDGVQRELITENFTSARIETVNFNDTTLTNGSATTKASSDCDSWMDLKLSDAEQYFIIHGVQEDLRNDGRRNDDYRPIILETDFLNNTSGSARVRLGNTDVLVGVKAEIDTPTAEAPDCGRFQFFVDCSANATPEFEGRGGDELAQDIADCLSKSYGKCSNALKKLCIVREQLCWFLYVDVVILECGGGNLYDCVSFAVKSALYDLKIPNAKPVYNEKERADVELNDDVYDVWRLDASEFPVLVTVGKIGVHAVVDMSAEEEKCRKSSIIVGVVGKTIDDSLITLMKQSGGGGSLDPDSISEMVDTGVKVGVKLNEKLLCKLNDNDKREKPSIRGFLT